MKSVPVNVPVNMIHPSDVRTLTAFSQLLWVKYNSAYLNSKNQHQFHEDINQCINTYTSPSVNQFIKDRIEPLEFSLWLINSNYHATGKQPPLEFVDKIPSPVMENPPQPPIELYNNNPNNNIINNASMRVAMLNRMRSYGTKTQGEKSIITNMVNRVADWYDKQKRVNKIQPPMSPFSIPPPFDPFRAFRTTGTNVSQPFVMPKIQREQHVTHPQSGTMIEIATDDDEILKKNNTFQQETDSISKKETNVNDNNDNDDILIDNSHSWDNKSKKSLVVKDKEKEVETEGVSTRHSRQVC